MVPAERTASAKMCVYFAFFFRTTGTPVSKRESERVALEVREVAGPTL